MTTTLEFIKGLFPPAWHHRLYLVGGTVRDLLSGVPCRDMDLTADLSGDELCAMGFRPVEPSSGAGIYFLHHKSAGKVEVSLIGGQGGVEGELRRRDFTANAIAMGLDGTLYDPLNGIDCLGPKLLRACTPRSFHDDPLRIFRGFRFECNGWRMTQDTETMITGGDWSQAFQQMPVERFSGEMRAALAGEHPGRFFEQMVRFGIGREFLPGLFLMPDIPAGPPVRHPEGDLFSHSLQVLQQVAARSGDPLARFCALFHDLGKLATDPEGYPGHDGHGEAGLGLAKAFCSSLRLPSAYGRALGNVSALHTMANRWNSLPDETKVMIAVRARRGGIDRILPLVSAADKPEGGISAEWAETCRAAAASVQELGLGPDELAALPAGIRPVRILQAQAAYLRCRRVGGGDC